MAFAISLRLSQRLGSSNVSLRSRRGQNYERFSFVSVLETYVSGLVSVLAQKVSCTFLTTCA